MSDVSLARQLNALVIGCGRAGGGYDIGRDDAAILTHAKAYARHEGFALRACIDPDRERREAVARCFSAGSAYGELEDCLERERTIDVASVCAPTAKHATILTRLLKTDIRAVWCEKPITDDVDSARMLVTAYRDAGKLLAVNYFRRWDRAVIELQRRIAGGEWGALQSVQAQYGKGILNNGSHVVDMLGMLFGKIAPRRVLRTHDAAGTLDPTLDAELTTPDRRPIYLIGTDARHFSMFEITLVFDQGVIAIENRGFRFRERPAIEDRLYPGYRVLADGATRDSDLAVAHLEAATNIHAALTRGQTLRSSGRTALDALETCARLRAMAESIGGCDT